MTDIKKVDRATWTFDVDGFHLDAPQQAKSRVADEELIDYDDLRAKVVKTPHKKIVVVVLV